VPRRCSVCDHPDRADIDRALAEGKTSIRGIARQFGLTEDAVLRHRDNHVPKRLIEIVEVRREMEDFDVFRKLRELEQVLTRAVARCGRTGDMRNLFAGSGRLISLYELYAKLQGVDIEPRLRAMASSMGLDPDEVVAEAQAIVNAAQNDRYGR
jgi:hypothetical protein